VSTRLGVRGVSLLLTGALALASARAGAQTKDECVDANTRAQSLRREGKFSAARAELRVCIDARCPGIVRDDCTQRLDELERAQPTIVFDAKSAIGDDIVLVRVAVDGVRLADVLDGRALAVDPGQHVFTFEVPGQAPTTLRFVLREGEKDRRERVVLAGAVEPTPAPPLAGTVAMGPPSGRGQRLAGIVLGAVGLAGLGVGAVFGALTIHDWSSSQSECRSPTDCPDHAAAMDDRDRAETASTVSTVGFITGGVLLVTGIVAWLTSAPGGSDSASAAAAVHLVPAAAPGGAGLSVTGSF
jgi:hypothetical protein